MDDDEIIDEPSVDDALEATRQSSTVKTVGQDALAEDNDPPAAPANDPIAPPIPVDDPSTDSGQDSSEVYEKGQTGLVDMPHTPGGDSR